MAREYKDMCEFEQRVHRNPTVWITGYNKRAVSRGEQIKRKQEGKSHIESRFEPFIAEFPQVMSRETYDMVYGDFAPKHNLFHAFRIMFMLDPR